MTDPGEPLKVLYVAGRFPKLSETFVLNEARGHLARGHDVRILSLRPSEDVGADLEELVRRTIVVPRLPVPRGLPRRSGLAVPEERPTRRVWALLAAGWAHDRGLGDFRPDVVHAHFANLPTLVAGILARRLGVPYTFIAHATDFQVRMSDALLRERVLHADRAFTISDANRRVMTRRAGLDPGAVDVVRAAVRPAPDVQPEREPASGAVFVSVARLVDMKGIDVALRAFAVASPQLPGARYVIIGDGPRRPELEALRDSLGLGASVVFRGSLPNAETQARIAGADVAVLPCRQDGEGMMDGIPVFLMEAGAHGIPVVTTGISGLPELVEDGLGGVVCPPDDVPATADALVRLGRDPHVRGSMGDALRRRVESEFGLELQLDRLERAWRELADAPRR